MGGPGGPLLDGTALVRVRRSGAAVTGPNPGIARLDPGARRRRGAATALVAALLLCGSAVGTDDWFPVGPFRMFTNRANPSGRVRVVTVEAVDAAGRARTIRPGDVGLRHAELEGQLPRFSTEPQLLAATAEAYASVHPDRPPLVSVELRERVRRLEDNVLSDEVRERTVARWERGGP